MHFIIFESHASPGTRLICLKANDVNQNVDHKYRIKKKTTLKLE